MQPPLNDKFANAISIGNGASGWEVGNNVGATAETGEPFGRGYSVWFKWKCPASGNYWFATNGSIGGGLNTAAYWTNFPSVIQVFTANVPATPTVAALTEVGYLQDQHAGVGAGFEFGAQVAFAATINTFYWIRVDSRDGLSAGKIELATGDILIRWDAWFTTTFGSCDDCFSTSGYPCKISGTGVTAAIGLVGLGNSNPGNYVVGVCSKVVSPPASLIWVVWGGTYELIASRAILPMQQWPFGFNTSNPQDISDGSNQFWPAGSFIVAPFAETSNTSYCSLYVATSDVPATQPFLKESGDYTGEFWNYTPGASLTPDYYSSQVNYNAGDIVQYNSFVFTAQKPVPSTWPRAVNSQFWEGGQSGCFFLTQCNSLPLCNAGGTIGFYYQAGIINTVPLGLPISLALYQIEMNTAVSASLSNFVVNGFANGHDASGGFSISANITFQNSMEQYGTENFSVKLLDQKGVNSPKVYNGITYVTGPLPVTSLNPLASTTISFSFIAFENILSTMVVQIGDACNSTISGTQSFQFELQSSVTFDCISLGSGFQCSGVTTPFVAWTVENIKNIGNIPTSNLKMDIALISTTGAVPLIGLCATPHTNPTAPALTISVTDIAGGASASQYNILVSKLDGKTTVVYQVTFHDDFNSWPAQTFSLLV